MSNINIYSSATAPPEYQPPPSYGQASLYPETPPQPLNFEYNGKMREPPLQNADHHQCTATSPEDISIVDVIKPTEKFRRLLIPGLGGSKIYCCCDKNSSTKPQKMYPSSVPGVRELSQHFFECKKTCTKILKSAMMVSVYRNFIKRTNCDTFSYDWRRPVIEHAHNLCEFLRADIDPTPIILIGHSLGGVIIRVMVEFLRPHDLLSNKIRHVFICGTPLLGSHDTNDYNCELQILPVLMQTQDTISFQNRPLILRENDIRRFFKYFGVSLMYLMPSFVVDQIFPFDRRTGIEQNDDVLQFGKHTTLSMEDFLLLRQTHRCLTKFDFPETVKYHFFYNVSREIDVKHAMDRNTIKHISRKTNIKSVEDFNHDDMTWKVVRSLKSDGLILACRKLPPNAIVWFDRSFATHSLLMNCPQISVLIGQFMNSAPEKV